MDSEREKIIRIWPKWKIQQAIGSGSFGTVYRACREEPGYTAWAAIKVIRIPKDESELRERKQEGMDDASIQYYYKNVAQELLNEIRVMESLKTASNIVSIEDCQLEPQENGPGWELYIRMELLESLPSYMERKPLSLDEIVKLGIDICEALKACETKNIIHRDIKPDNIFVNEYGTFKLGDFGIAKRLENTRAMLSQKGTSMYMAPELYRGGTGGKTVDIYALGITLYKLLNSGRFPFMPPYPQPVTPDLREQALYRRLNGELVPPPPGIDPVLGAMVAKACAPDPGMRYQTALEFQNDLTRWRDGFRSRQTMNSFVGEPTSEGTQKMWGVSGNDPSGYRQTGAGQSTGVGGRSPYTTTDSFEKQPQDMYQVQDQTSQSPYQNKGTYGSGGGQPPKKKGNGAKIAIGVAAGVCAFALCFGAGYFLLGNKGSSSNRVASNIPSTQASADTSPTDDFTADTPLAQEPLETESPAGETGEAVAIYDTDRLLPGDQTQLRFQSGSLVMTASPGELVWTSSDEAVATVDEQGILTAQGVGTAQITGQYNGTSASFQVHVVEVNTAYGATIEPDVDSIAMASSALGSDPSTSVNFTLGGNVPDRYTVYAYVSPEIFMGLSGEWSGGTYPVVTLKLTSSIYTGEGTVTVLLMPEDEPYNIIAATKVKVTIS